MLVFIFIKRRGLQERGRETETLAVINVDIGHRIIFSLLSQLQMVGA